MKIVVERRSNHYHAAFAQDRGRWGDGKTDDEAVGNLVRTHGEALGIRVEVIGEPLETEVVIACPGQDTSDSVSTQP
ncbi:MAG: hypothetical protein WCJ64_07015 [Rhodospirillaceae bacterium]